MYRVLLLMAYHLYEKLSRVLLYYYRVPFFPFVFSTFLLLFLLRLLPRLVLLPVALLRLCLTPRPARCYFIACFFITNIPRRPAGMPALP